MEEATILQLESFFEVSLDLLCIRDREGRLLKVNPAWETSLGYRPEELEGVAVFCGVHTADQSSHPAPINKVG